MQIECDPELLKVCDRVKYANYDELVKSLPNPNTVRLDDSNSYLKINPTKLGTAVLAVKKGCRRRRED